MLDCLPPIWDGSIAETPSVEPCPARSTRSQCAQSVVAERRGLGTTKKGVPRRGTWRDFTKISIGV